MRAEFAKLSRIKTKALLVLSFLIIASSASPAGRYSWDFTDPDGARGWQSDNAHIEKVRDGILIVRGRDPFRLISPTGLNIPSGLSFVEFRFKAEATNLFGTISIVTADNRLWSYKYVFAQPMRMLSTNVYEFQTHRIRLDKFVRSDAPIVSFSLGFSGLNKVELGYVKFFSLSFGEAFREYWLQFWDAGYLTGDTINFIDTPRIGRFSFLSVLYCGFLLMTSAAIFRYRPLTLHSFRSAAVMSCVVIGVLFAARMDYKWYKWWLMDSKALAPLPVGRRYAVLENGDYFDIAEQIRGVVSDRSEKVRILSGNDYQMVRLRYHLLPIKTSEQAGYIVVYRDKEISFDPLTGCLMKNGSVMAENVTPLKILSSDAVIYRKIAGPLRQVPGRDDR